ncbi:hypothetical protein [Streptomyces azureus]|nr:hypothetical protein [Streptomyces azureus]
MLGERPPSAAGFEIEARFGGWNREAVTGSSREIITVARRG